MTKKVDFIIIGAMKSATTSVADILKQHPKLSFCKYKEPHFFSKPNCLENIAEYHSLYNFDLDKIFGEASTSYTFYPEIIDTEKRIFEYNPNIKLIYIMRNPIDRIESHFAHRLIPKRNKSGKIYQEIINNPEYINRSKYYTQLSNYYKYFNPSQIKLCFFEDYVNNTQDFFNEIFDFLEIDSIIIEEIKSNPSINRSTISDFGKSFLNSALVKTFPYSLRKKLEPFFYNKIEKSPKLTIEERQKLFKVLELEINKISELTNRNLTNWK